jgi:hypothetical protein
MTVDDLDKVGVRAYPSTLSVELVNELERLGYSALWLADPGTDLRDSLLAAG